MKHCHLVTTMERGRGRGKYKKGRQDKSRRNGCIVNKEKFTKSPSLTCEGSLLLQFWFQPGQNFDRCSSCKHKVWIFRNLQLCYFWLWLVPILNHISSYCLWNVLLSNLGSKPRASDLASCRALSADDWGRVRVFLFCVPNTRDKLSQELISKSVKHP